MSQAIASPSLGTSLRRFAARAWDDPDSRSTLIGIAGVLFVHLLLLLFAPRLLRLEHAPSVLRPHSSSRQFNIEIAPETFAKPLPKPPPPKQFVETNPDAPENTPDKTNNFAAQNQQVAQPKPTPNGNSERPATEGKKDFQSNQIVSGRLEKPIEQIEPAPTPPMPPQPATTAAPRAEQNPLPGFEKKQGDNPDTFGTNIANASANPRAIPERIEGEKDVPIVDGATDTQPAIDPQHPRARPSLTRQPQTRPAILAENKIGTRNLGVIAINAKFNDYGLYLQRMVDAVQLEFDKLANEAATRPPNDTYVIVTFILNSEGKIATIEKTENHTTEIGARTAVSAITNRAPYGAWTDDMKATLNPQGEELVFTFYYQ